MGRFSGKRIVVTGGTSGIGLAGARRLASEGAEVVVTGRNEPNGSTGQRPEAIRFIRNDAGDPDAGQQLLRALPIEDGFDGRP